MTRMTRAIALRDNLTCHDVFGWLMTLSEIEQDIQTIYDALEQEAELAQLKALVIDGEHP